MKINNYNIRRKGLEPLIATILLIVVSVILVTIVLTWGKEFSTSSLNKTNNFAELKVSDATHFIYPKSAQEGIIQFTYSPPAEIKQDINVTHYRVINIPEMTEPIVLSEPKILSPSLNILELPCLYEYSTTTPDLYIQLITADNTYIDIKTKDAGMMCTPGGDGTEEDPIIICDAEDLNLLRGSGYGISGKYFKLGKDVDLQCFSRLDVNGWDPIGDEDIYFENGGFDGQNHTISNLYINRPATDYVGLFGYIYTEDNFEIKNLGLEDVNVIGNYIVGSLAGILDNVSEMLISNVSSTGEVFGSGYVGGLIGANYGATILNSHSSGNISATEIVGGLVGENVRDIENSYFLGSASGSNGIGGLVGANHDYTITNCYSIGEISGIENAGGIVGSNSGNVENSYFLGNVTGTNTLGGLIGQNFGTILNSYSSGSVTGEVAIGGLIGNNSGDITNCYSTNFIIGQTTVGGIIGYDEGTIVNSYWDYILTDGLFNEDGAKTTAEMKLQETYSDWNFTTVWTIDEGTSYPYLIMNKQTPPPTPTLNVWAIWWTYPNWLCIFDRWFPMTLYSNGNKTYYTTDETLPSCDLTENLNQIEYTGPISITTNPRITDIYAIACNSSTSSEIKQYGCT